MRAAAAALAGCMLAPAAVALAQAPAGGDPSGAARVQLVSLLNNVTGASASSYRTHDSGGASTDALKIIPLGAGYVGVYHVFSGGTFSVRVATSSDLLHWSVAATLASDASQPTIAAMPGGGFLVSLEKNQRSPLDLFAATSHLEFLYFADAPSLLAGRSAQNFDAPNSLSAQHEGTPSIGSVSVGPPAPGVLGVLGGAPLSNSTINVGFHYYNASIRVDRNATGVLTNFSQWSEQDAAALNAAFPASVHGNIGDRDYIDFGGFPFTLIEAQNQRLAFGTFRVYLYDNTAGTLTAVAPRTAGGSLAFGNPTATVVTDPAGRRALAMTLYLFGEAAAAGEAGPLVYYTEF